MRLVMRRNFQAPGLASLSNLMQLYVERAGKRIRPQLAIWTYLNAADSSDAHLPSAVLDVASAWEIFHAFLLIHDDIIDGSDRRREHPSLHRQLQSLDSNSPRFGMNLGIVAGDLMYAAAQRILADLDIPAESYRQMHRLFAHVASLTGFGQAVDILQSHVPLEACDEETLVREYQWKTAAYTFEGPMLAGAILANVSDGARESISAFALAVGQAYQLQNDLLDLARPASEGCDLVEGKRTLTLLRARAGRTERERAAFDATIARIQNAESPRAIELAESLRRELIAGDAVRQTDETIRALIHDATVAAEHRALPPTLGQAMRGLLQTLGSTYFSPVVIEAA
jgi:geranylgeranyl diphosphate synthase, type I